MRILSVAPQKDWTLLVVAEDGRTGSFDVKPYLEAEVFQPLQAYDEFANVLNGVYFVEWGCGADLSVDTVEAKWQVDKAAKARCLPAQA